MRFQTYSGRPNSYYNTISISSKKKFGRKLFFIVLFLLIFFYFVKSTETSFIIREEAKKTIAGKLVSPSSVESSKELNASKPLSSQTSNSDALGAKDLAFVRDYVKHKIQRGDTLSDLAHRYGFSILEATEIYRALKKASLESKGDFSAKLMTGKLLELSFDIDGKLDALVLHRDPSFKVAVIKDKEKGFVVEVKKEDTSLKEFSSAGVINTSFSVAAQKSGIPIFVVDDFVDLFGGKIEFKKDLHKGDSFSVIYTDQVLKDGSRLGKGEILSASLVAQGKEFVAFRFIGKDGKKRYFNKDGKLLGNQFLRYPTAYTRISSYFSKARFHPVLKRYKPHNGVDFAAPVGTPVRTVADGKVVFAGRKGPSGLMVKISHGDRYSTAYLHLSRISKGVRKGKRVSRGQIIGKVGATGRTTGPHLHYSFYDRGKYVDPMKIDLPTIDTLKITDKASKSYIEKVVSTLRNLRNRKHSRE